MRGAAVAMVATTLAFIGVFPPTTAVSDISTRGVLTCHGQVATFVGTSGEDRVDGEELAPGSVLVLRDGRDYLEGFLRKDIVVCGGPGDDSLDARDSHSGILLDGGAGSDYAGDFADPDFVNSGRMTVLGGPGRDSLIGGGAASKLAGQGGRDSVSGWTGRDVVRGGAGDDRISGYFGRDRLFGGSGDDKLDGDPPTVPSRRDFANGNAGTDRCAAEVKRNCELPL